MKSSNQLPYIETTQISKGWQWIILLSASLALLGVLFFFVQSDTDLLQDRLARTLPLFIMTALFICYRLLRKINFKIAITSRGIQYGWGLPVFGSEFIPVSLIERVAVSDQIKSEHMGISAAGIWRANAENRTGIILYLRNGTTKSLESADPSALKDAVDQAIRTHSTQT